MAIRYAIAAGSIDDPTKWDGGVSVPTSADDVYLNNFAMTAAAGSDIEYLSLRSTSNASPAINAGGSLTISGARNFTFTDMFMRTDAVANTLITITAASGIVSITGAARNGTPTGTSSYCINRTGNCNFVFNGSILPQAGATANVMNFAGTGSVTIGSMGSPVTFGLAVASGINVNNSAIVFQMWADQFAGNAGTALNLSAYASAYTNGTVYGGSASSRYGIASAATTAVTHTHDGDVYAGNSGSTPGGIAKTGVSTLILNGDVYSTTTYGVSNAVSVLGGNFTFNGNVIVGPTLPLSVTGGNFTLNIGSITRPVTQANVQGVSIGLAATGSINVASPIAGGTGGSSAAAITLGGTANKQLTAPSISGGGAANIPGVSVTSTAGIITINSDAVAADFLGANGIAVSGLGCTVVVNGKVTGNGYGVGSAIVGPAAGISVTVLSTVSVREIESGPRGQSGIIGPVLMLSSSLNKSTFRQSINGQITELTLAGGGLRSYGYMGGF